MVGLISVDRSDGPAVAGLLTSMLANWERIPISVQAAIMADATAAAFESTGRLDGHYVVTAFVLKHRAALEREARWNRVRVRPPSNGRRRSPPGVAGGWLAKVASFRMASLDALRPRVPRTRHAPWWASLLSRRVPRRRAA